MKYKLYSIKRHKNDLGGIVQLYWGHKLVINSIYVSYIVEIDKKDCNNENIVYLLLNPSSEVFQKVIKTHFDPECILDECEFLDNMEREYYRLKYA